MDYLTSPLTTSDHVFYRTVQWLEHRSTKKPILVKDAFAILGVPNCEELGEFKRRI